MKLLIVENIILEGIKEKLQKKYGLTNGEMMVLGMIDPTPTKKLLEWITKHYVEDMRNTNGYPSAREAEKQSFTSGFHAKYQPVIESWLENIEKKKNNPEFIKDLTELLANPNHPIVKSPADINVYDSLYVLKSITEFAEAFMSKADIKKQSIKKKIGNYLIVVPKSEGASCYYGAGTKWCTAAKNANYFDKYAKDAIVFYVINLGKEEGEPLQKVAALKYFNPHYKDTYDIDVGDYTLWNVADKQLKGLEPEDIFPKDVVKWMEEYYNKSIDAPLPLTVKAKTKAIIESLHTMDGMYLEHTLGPGWRFDSSDYEMDGTVSFAKEVPPEGWYIVYATPYYDGRNIVPVELQGPEGDVLANTSFALTPVTNKHEKVGPTLAADYMKNMKSIIKDFIEEFNIHDHTWLKVNADREFCSECGESRELGVDSYPDSDNKKGPMTYDDYDVLPEEYLFDVAIDQLGLTADEMRAAGDKKAQIELIMSKGESKSEESKEEIKGLENAKQRLSKSEQITDLEFSNTDKGEKFLKIHYKEKGPGGGPEFVSVKYNTPEELQTIYQSLDLHLTEAEKTKKGKSVSKKYLTKNKSAMKKEIDKYSGKSTYKTKWDADYKSGKGGKGKRYKTKRGSASDAYKSMYGESYLIDEDTDKTLSNKSKDTGISKTILKKVHSRGMAAWNAGHRPGTPQNAWAMGRVNSFITGVGGARKADADLWKKAKKQKAKKRKSKKNESVNVSLSQTELTEMATYVTFKKKISEGLEYHIEREIPLSENVFRFGSESYFNLIKEAKESHKNNVITFSKEDTEFLNSHAGEFGIYEGEEVPLDIPMINEAEYKGKEVELNKPKRNTGSGKKYYVYVKDPKSGNIRKISFGDVKGGLTAKVSDPEARKRFSTRHNCPDKKDKTTAGYWACRANRYGNLWGGKTYPGFW